VANNIYANITNKLLTLDFIFFLSMKKIAIVVILCCSFLYSKGQDSAWANVYFEFDKYELTTAALESMATNLAIDTNKFRVTKLNIYGHTDQKGSVAYNNKLSFKRAAAVANYFISLGVPAEKIQTIIGFGKSQLITNSMDESSRQINRRVLIVMYAEPKITVAATPPNLTKPQTSIEKLREGNLKQGEFLVLEDILFYGSRHVFTKTSYESLFNLVEIMHQRQSLQIEIHGHICCVEGVGDGYDMDTQTEDLSYQRAKALYEFLVMQGIRKERMSYKGFGHSKPLTLERNDFERQRNRRVEIKIVKL
jgi:outer membrane protein OmpA-like peptidoglycan-associated protein